MPAMMPSCCLTLTLIACSCALAYATDASDTASILGFGVAGSDVDYKNVVDLGDLVTFACKASGNPSPLVSIWKKSLYYGDESYYKQAGATYGSNTITKTATCADNGSYRCRAENTFQGQSYVVFKDLVTDFRVRCPPSSCSGTDDPQTCTVTPGSQATCPICLVGFPHVDYDDYVLEEHIEKETLSGWETSLNLHIGGETLEEPSYLRIAYWHPNNISVGDLGNYRLVWSWQSQNNTRSESYVYFQVTDEIPTVTPETTPSLTTSSNSISDQTTSSNSSSDKDSNSESYLSLSTEAKVDMALAGLLVLTFTIVIVQCVYVCGINNRLTRVSPHAA